MRLQRIKTKNYRTLENLEINFSKNYCTISGRNNAGKSSVIRLLSNLSRPSSIYPFAVREPELEYQSDKTQWLRDAPPIEIEYVFEVTRDEDPALISFMERIATQKIAKASTVLSLSLSVSESDDITVTASIDKGAVDAKAAKEIRKRIRDSNLFFLYNSTSHDEQFILGPGRRRLFYQILMTADEKKAVELANKQLERSIRKFAREHTQSLGEMLGRLTEKYDVEVSPPEGYTTRRMPLGISLRDKNVDVPLDDWGSGTQNRTQILMAILQANRIKATGSADEKITPIVVIEEPESFLHPSAQAEFGRVLRHLSGEFGIQILATTHSPHMLNLEEPSSNILLTREVRRKKLYATIIQRTDGESWMAPFSEHLGISKDDFALLKPIFSGEKSKVLLVEGPIDKEYFEFLRSACPNCESLDATIEVVPYEGKDTLKNTLLVQFVLSKFDRVFVTYDLDSDVEIKKYLSRLGLKEGTDYAPIGISKPGKDCLEGLLPERVLSGVNGRETDLVMKLGSRDNAERRDAKDRLKKEYLAEFKKLNDITKDELKDLSRVVKLVNARLLGGSVS